MGACIMHGTVDRALLIGVATVAKRKALFVMFVDRIPQFHAQ